MKFVPPASRLISWRLKVKQEFYLHGTAGQRPVDLFAQEQLTPLTSVAPYRFIDPVDRTVSWEALVQFAGSATRCPRLRRARWWPLPPRGDGSWCVPATRSSPSTGKRVNPASAWSPRNTWPSCGSSRFNTSREKLTVLVVPEKHDALFDGWWYRGAVIALDLAFSAMATPHHGRNDAPVRSDMLEDPIESIGEDNKLWNRKGRVPLGP
jgi:hypothetical protein